MTIHTGSNHPTQRQFIADLVVPGMIIEDQGQRYLVTASRYTDIGNVELKCWQPDILLQADRTERRLTAETNYSERRWYRLDEYLTVLEGDVFENGTLDETIAEADDCDGCGWEGHWLAPILR